MNKAIAKKANLTINIAKEDRARLIDPSTGILLHPLEINIKKNKKQIRYKGLWLGEFDLCLMSAEKPIRININTDSSYANNLYKITFSYHLNRKYLDTFGWDYAFKNSEIITVCDYLKKEVKKNTNKDASTIPIPISKKDLPRKIKDLDLKHPSALIVQNHQIKQKSEALVSFKNAIKKLPEVTFYISKGLPENRDNKNYKNVISTLSPLKNVVFVDIDSSNKYDYLNSVDIYILRSGLDCTPATVLEAGLAKKPIIASAIGGVPEMIINGKTGFVIQNENNEEWISKIKKILTEGSSKNMGEEAYKHVIKNYELKHISKKLIEEITSLK